jgi:hypothetical protein
MQTSWPDDGRNVSITNTRCAELACWSMGAATTILFECTAKSSPRICMRPNFRGLGATETCEPHLGHSANTKTVLLRSALGLHWSEKP